MVYRYIVKHALGTGVSHTCMLGVSVFGEGLWPGSFVIALGTGVSQT